MKNHTALSNALLLGLLGLVASPLVVITHLGTEERIAENRRQTKSAPLLAIIPRERYDNDLLSDAVMVESFSLLGLQQPQMAYVARLREKPVAIILPAVARDGYGGPIQLMVGLYADGTVAAVHVHSHRETPGIGDRIDRANGSWIESFTGRSLQSPPPDLWAPHRDGGDFDQLTGATITSRAVTTAVRGALQFLDERRDTLLMKNQPGNHDDGRRHP